MNLEKLLENIKEGKVLKTDQHWTGTRLASHLHLFVQSTDLNLIKKALDVLGEDALNAKDEWGETPLHYAARLQPDRAVYDLLVAQGADETIKEKMDGATPKAIIEERFPKQTSTEPVMLNFELSNIDKNGEAKLSYGADF